MGPCPWSCHSPGYGQGTDWSLGRDITAFRKSCSHLIMVLSLLSITLPGPTILPCLLPFIPHLLSWGAVSKREERVRAALGSQQPCQYGSAWRFRLHSLLYPSHTRDRGLKQSNEQHGCRQQPPASWAQQGWELPGTTAESDMWWPVLSPLEGGSPDTPAT